MLDDGVTRVFLNVAGDRHRVSKELVSLMDYINDGKVSDEYTKELEDTVETLREDDGSEALYMTYQQTIMEHEARAWKAGRNEGRNEGRVEATFANAVAMLKDNLSWAKIQQYTSLPLAQIEKLAKENALL